MSGHQWARGVRLAGRLRVFSLVAVALLATACAGMLLGHGRASSGRKVTEISDTCQPKLTTPPVGIRDIYDRQVLSDGPVMYLSMGNAASGREMDFSGNGNAGTYFPQKPLPGSALLPNGDDAALFNGRGQYLEIPSKATLSVNDTGCLTVQAWVRPAALQFPEEEGSGYVYILGKGSYGAQEYALRMYSRSNTEVPPRPNRVSAYVFNPGGGEGSGTYFQDQLTVNSWIMVTFVIDDERSVSWPAGYVAIYKNNVLRGQVSLSQFDVTPRAGDAPLRVGTRQLESFFDGAIGKVAVFDYVLSAQQVSAIYAAM